jgi:hypothetical protein
LTGYRITEVTLCLCAFGAVAQWLGLTSPQGYRGGSFRESCLGVVLLWLPYASLFGVSYAVGNSSLASVVALVASVLVAMIPLFARYMTRGKNFDDGHIFFTLLFSWLVVLIALPLVGLAFLVDH